MSEGVAEPAAIVELKNGVKITPKITLSVIWTFGRKFGAMWALQEALLTDDNKQSNKSAIQAGVFTVTEPPAAKKAKTDAPVSSN